MTAELAALLGDLLDIRGLEWDRVALVRNIGPLVPSVELPGDLVVNRGLCAVVGDRRGEPLWFCKLRPAHFGLFRHEAAITAELARELANSGIVPEARTVVAGSIAVLATRWVPGHSLSRALDSARGAAWQRLADRALAAGGAVRDVLSRHPVEGTAPGAAEGFADDFRLATGRAEEDDGLQAAIQALPPAHKVGKDAKTRLQEWLQGRQKALPVYELLSESGEEHAKTFHVSCTLAQPALRTEGQGSSRRAAEQLAAEAALEQIEGLRR